MESLKKKMEEVKEIIKEEIIQLKLEEITVEYSDEYDKLLYIRGYKNNEEYLTLTLWMDTLFPFFNDLTEKEQEKIKIDIIEQIDNFLEQNGYKFSLDTYSYQKTST
jgi:hypothetical protein